MLSQEESHPLQRRYSFWLSVVPGGKEESNWFEDSLKNLGSLIVHHSIGSVSSVEDFWGFY